MDKAEKWTRIRIKLVSGVFLLAFAAILARAFCLQVLAEDEWQKRAENQRQKVIPLTPQRGTIFDRNHEALAISVQADSLYANPHDVQDPAAEARTLSKVLGVSASAIRKKLMSSKGFVWIKRQLTPDVGDKATSLDLPGIHSTKEHRRYYPNGQVASQVLGFTGIDPKGLEGVELKYDAQLLGHGGYLLSERDALGRGIGSGEEVVKGQSEGCDLYLTIDRNLQYIAEKELTAGVKETNAKAGTVIVLDPWTGEVLAMASQPDYNPNFFRKYRPSQWRNRAVVDTFEPGSTLKPFVLATALDQGVISSRQKIFCENGHFSVGGKVIHDHKRYGRLSIAEILKYSSNIGAAKIGKALERQRLYEALREFGFGAPTGIDLNGEASGLLREPQRWFEVDLAAISFGQGLTVTPLQLAVATAAIANGGKVMRPYVVERIVNSYGENVEKTDPHTVRRVVSEKTAETIRAMMTMVTEEGGTGTLAAVPGFKIAGKTGTAQKVDPVTGGYSPDKRVSSFVGFAPAEDPKVVILVVIDEPQGMAYGGLVAAPVFSRIAGQVLRYDHVAPTDPQQVPSLPPVSEVAAFALPDPQQQAVNQDDKLQRMPDLAGLSFRQVLQMMKRTGINLKLDGHGRVVKQFPAAGQPLRYDKEAWVKLSPPT